MGTPKKSSFCTACFFFFIFLLFFISHASAIELSSKENDYLRTKGTIVFVSQTRYPPFEFTDTNRQHEGMMLDFVRWMAVEIGFNPVFMDMTFQQAQEAVLSGKADIITSLFYSDKRKERFEFTETLFDVPAAIFIRAERTDIKDIKNLTGKTIAIQRGDYAKDFLESEKIRFDVLDTEDFAEATDMVISGKADAVIGDEQIVLYHIFSNRLTDYIKKMGEPLYVGRNCMASNKNNAILIRILNKGINEARKSGVLDKISAKWLGSKYGHQESFLERYLWQVSALTGGLLLLSLLVWAWNVRLRTLVRKKTEIISLREEVLRQREAYLSAIIENQPGLIWIKDTAGKFLAVNQAFAISCGKQNGEELVGKTDLDILPSALAEKHRSDDYLVTETGEPNIVEEPVYDGGETRWHETFRTPVFDGQGKIIGTTGYTRDITERKRMEESLMESREELAEIFSMSLDMICIADINTATFLKVNPAFTRILGYPEHELLKRPFLDFIHPDDVESTIAVINNKLQKGERAIDFTNRYRCKDGAYRWLSWMSHPIPKRGITFAVAHDITERKRVEDALAQSEKKYRMVLETNPDPMIVYDKEGKVIYLNPAFTRVFGWSLEERIGKKLDDFVPDESWPETRMMINMVIAGENFSGIETLRLTREGKVIPVSISGSCYRNHEGNIEISVINLRDITRHKQAEKEKAKLEEQYKQAQKMEAIGQLAGGVAHDFNNMLSIILGYSQMAMREIDSSSQAYTNIQEIINAARSSADLVRQLLAFARKQTIAPKVLDLNDIVAGMLNMLPKLIGEEINLLWIPAANLWPVKMDPAQVDQIVANLTVNARDSISGVGKITIETGNAEFNEADCATNVDLIPGQYVLLAFSDNGCGIDKEIMEQIFEPFFTTKEFGKGTGMGLATVYGIVKQNNGFINIYSELGKGTTFKIYLPRFGGEKPAIDKTRTHAEPLTGTETVLLVEDNEALLELCKVMLEKLGYAVLTASTPDEAIRLAGEHACGDIHLVVTDVVMPNMSGRDMQKQLSILLPSLKFLFMSGYTANFIAHRGILYEGVHFLQKPFTMNDLAAKVRKALEGGL